MKAAEKHLALLSSTPAFAEALCVGERRDSEQATVPTVSIFMITYQHAPYIRQALDSVLMQQTDFPVEICLGEDQSTDGTREICQEYAAKYPCVIRLFLRDRSDPARQRYRAPFMYNVVETMKACRGKYVALLEGDDFWLDPRKLQKQGDFLEANPDCTVCGHPVIVWDPLGIQGPASMVNPAPGKYSLAEVADGVYAHTSSLVIRNGTFEEWGTHFADCPGSDVPLLMLALRSGCLVVLSDEMSCYRIHAGGVVSGKTDVGKASHHIEIARAVARSGLFSPEATGRVVASMMGNTLVYPPEKDEEIRAMWEQQRDWCAFAPEMFQLCCESRAKYRAANLRIKSSRSYVVGHLILQPLRALRYLFALLGRNTFRGRGGLFKAAGKG